MRYLTEAFIVGALKRGRPVEQFLGPINAPGRPGVSYVEVRSAEASYQVYVHTVEDVGHERFFDLVEFPPLDADEDEEEFGRLVATAEDPSTALTTAEEPRAQYRGGGATRAWSRMSMPTSFERAGLRTNLPMDSPGQAAEPAADMPSSECLTA
ncbi:hypothetical protein [Streptomyces mirabilis]|uniref:hypothetical protein n=1 Tax=Streptomyces mirabilis TaxID=68239 RepID=UPI00364C6E4A